MTDKLSDEEKELFKRMAANRKARGIRLCKWSVMLESSAVDAIETLWESWVRALGKRDAEDNLVEAMANQHELIRNRLLYAAHQNKHDRKQEGYRSDQGSPT